MKLKDRVAIVTGAGQGIGRAIALSLAKEGVKVVVNDIDLKTAEKVSREIEDYGNIAIPFQADISNNNQVKKMVEETVQGFGKIDILVNNAGIMQFKTVEEITEEDWDRMMAINLKGTFLCCRSVMKYMKEQKSGKIVNISSLSGKSGGIMVGANYSASKAGVLAFTKLLARELAAYKINVNAVCPGTTDTDMAKKFSPEKKKALINAIPLRRFAETQDIANAVIFLVSEESNYITGATLDVNGGLLMS